MIKIEYSYTNYSDLFKHFVKTLQLRVKDNIAFISPELGSGEVRVMHLQNGIQLLFSDMILKEELLLHRRKSSPDFYVMRIDEVTDSNNTVKASLFFGDTSNEIYYLTPANNQLRNVTFLIDKSWLENFLNAEKNGDLLRKNVLLTTPVYHSEILDSEYRRLIDEMITVSIDNNFEKFIVHNRTLLILERFFSRYYHRISEKTQSVKATSDELQRLKNAESLMLKDFSFTPPNINQLARTAAMSTSKFKLLFKEVYGLPVYQYYQKHRLQKGKAMLLSKKYSVKQVTMELGYTHVKDFVKAFQKHFDQEPEEVLT